MKIFKISFTETEIETIQQMFTYLGDKESFFSRELDADDPHLLDVKDQLNLIAHINHVIEYETPILENVE